MRTLILLVSTLLLVAANASAQTPGDMIPSTATPYPGVNQSLTFTASYPIDGDNSLDYPSDGSPELDVSIGSSGCSFLLQMTAGQSGGYLTVSDSTNCQVTLTNSSYYQGSMSFSVDISFSSALLGQTLPVY